MEGTFTTCNGHLFFISPDGCEHDLGRVCECRSGPQGFPGPPGPPGPTIINVKASQNQLEFTLEDNRIITVNANFAAGPAGPAGAPGLDGRNGVDAARILNMEQRDNEIKTTLSDGRSYRFVLPKGEKGPPGDSGVGISNVYQNGDRTILVLSDGREYNLNLQGKSLSEVSTCENKLLFTFNDGTSKTVDFPSFLNYISFIGAQENDFENWKNLKSIILQPGKHIITYNVVAELYPSNLFDSQQLETARVQLHLGLESVVGSDAICQVYISGDSPVKHTLSSICIINVKHKTSLHLMTSAASNVKFTSPNIHTLSF
jgi:hypothetical protein